MFFVHGVIIILTILNIIVYYLGRREEEGEKGEDSSSSLRQEEEEEEEEEEGEKEYGEKGEDSSSSLRQDEEEEDGEKGEDSSSSLRHLSCRCFSIDHIRLATNNFDESLVIGEGGFGKVYKGTIDVGADPVAIKRLSFSSRQGVAEFRTELELLSKFRHSHLVSLIGYCEARPEMILVYEYMPAGSLSDHLHKNRSPPLSWVHRLNICIHAARGLDYLHTGTSINERVIHCDVKSSNILLDENFAAKVSDFGLSRSAPVNPLSTNCDYTNRNMGTFGYMDLESFYTRRATRKTDVYAFGVVLFEALCGRPAVDSSLDDEQCGLAGWAKICVREGTINQIIDPFLRREILSGCLDVFVRIAYKCLHDQSKNRPTMANVIAMLEYALAIQEGRDVVARVESRLSLQERRSSPLLDRQVANPTSSHPGALHDKHWTGYFTKRTRKLRFTKKMMSLFSPKLPAVSEKSFRSKIVELLAEMDNRPCIFSYAELRHATGDFDPSNKLGEGGFGPVYKGTLDDGRVIAVKQLSVESHHGKSQFMAEISMISSVQHRNLMKLYGYCIDGEKRLFVYEYLENKSLDQALFGDRSLFLDWPTRFDICLGIAKGLTYLHEKSRVRIVHRDVKASNVLLDSNLIPKISNFGLAKVYDDKKTHMSTGVAGTVGYISPEYMMHGHITEKTDVFDFGVVALEIVSGRPNCDARLEEDKIYLLEWAWNLLEKNHEVELVDTSLSEFDENEVKRVIRVSLLCIQTSSILRPTMSRVVAMLSGDAEVTTASTKPGYLTDWKFSDVTSFMSD